MQHYLELLQLYYTTDTLNFAMKKNYKEKDFYRYLKDNLKGISLVRIENTALLGTPDIFAINSNYNWFPIELKVIKGNSKPRFSPHQIAFFYRFPKNTFIMILKNINQNLKITTSRHSSKVCEILLYGGDQIESLVSRGIETKPLAIGLESCNEMLSNL